MFKSDSKKIKQMIILLILFIMLLLASCAVYADYPYGVWQSENPNITLIIDPNYQLDEDPGRFPGIYVKDTGTEDVIVTLDLVGAGLAIHNVSIGEAVAYHRYADFLGSYRIRRDRMDFTLVRSLREELGVDRIVFELVEEVEVP